MSTNIINQDEFNGEILINKFYGGKERGVCFQLTIANPQGYTQMTFDETINFLEEALKRIKNMKQLNNSQQKERGRNE